MVYTVKKSIAVGEDGKKITMYGIEAWEKGLKVISTTTDVFFDKKEAETFAEQCTTLGLAPEHLFEVIEDVLNK